MMTAAIKIAASIIALAFWIAASSWLYLISAGRLDLFVFPYWQWFMAAPYFQAMPIRVGLSAFFPFAVVMGVASLVTRKSPDNRRLRTIDPTTPPADIERANTDNYGHAALMDTKTAREMFPASEGKLIGLNPDGLLFDEVEGTSGISLEFVGTRSLKTMRAVTMLAFWPNSRLVFDPAQEIAHMMWRFLSACGQRVYIMNPDTEPKDRDGNVYPWAPLIAKTNIISWIDVNDPLAAMHIHTIAGLFFEADSIQKTDSGEFFSGTAESLLAALIAHVLWDEGTKAEQQETVHPWLSLDPSRPVKDSVSIKAVEPAPRDMLSVREYISLSGNDLRVALGYISANSPSALARRYAGPLVDEHHETFSNIHSTCHQATRWLAIDNLADMVCGDDFALTDIAHDPKMALFIQPPMTICMNFRNLPRVIFGALMAVKVRAPDDTFPLVLIDESWMLKVEAIREIVLAGGKYRIALHMLWQSVGDLDRIWGRDTRKSFFDGAAWVAMGPLGDIQAAKEVSEACGTYGALVHSKGDNTSMQAGTSLWGRWGRGKNWNVSAMARPVFYAHEVIQKLRRDQRLIMRLPQPLLVRAAPYFEVRELDGWIDDSPYRRARQERQPWYRLILRLRNVVRST